MLDAKAWLVFRFVLCLDQAMPNWLLTPQLLRVQSHRAKLIRFRRLHQCQSHEARMMLKAKNLQVRQSITVFETRMIQTPAGLLEKLLVQKTDWKPDIH